MKRPIYLCPPEWSSEQKANWARRFEQYMALWYKRFRALEKRHPSLSREELVELAHALA